MRRFLSVLSVTLVLPLAACFDVDLSLNFDGENSAAGTMVMTASPEFYAMTTQSGDPFCEAEEKTLEDGSHTCTDSFSGTIDELLADPNMGEGMSIERRDGGLVYIAFDLRDISNKVAPPQEDTKDGADEMKQMMVTAFTGHAITLSVAGAEIVETNGTLSDDGKTATFTIPLEVLLDDNNDLPDAFETTLKPGS